MRINDDFADAENPQTRERDLKQRAAVDFYQRFRAIVGERPQTRAEAGGKDHGFHSPGFSSSSLSNSRCRNTTSIPFLPRKCFASCSARYTERCCPPVQPNDTIRFLNPRR